MLKLVLLFLSIFLNFRPSFTRNGAKQTTNASVTKGKDIENAPSASGPSGKLEIGSSSGISNVPVNGFNSETVPNEKVIASEHISEASMELKQCSQVAGPSTTCILGVDLFSAVPAVEQSKAIFLAKNGREMLCRCSKCAEFYSQKRIGFLLDAEDSIAEYEKIATQKRNEKLQQQEQEGGLDMSFLGPYALRISCGARDDVHTRPTNTLWFKDFAYTGGIPANGTRPSFVTPPLQTLRHFPLSEGPENCYNINRVPHGHYSVRIFFGLLAEPSFDNEPLFDVSVEGTLIYSLPSGWSNHDDERAFVEALIFLTDGTASLCFHSTGHGDPAILSIEILQVDDRAYFFGPEWGQGTILRTDRRLSCGNKSPKFDVDYSGDHWGGDRFWNSITTFGQSADTTISTENKIKLASNAPNFYPEALYQTALISTNSQPDLTYSMDVDPNRNYSIWLHFAEIDPTVTGAGQRVFDILVNGDIAFQDIDIAAMTGDLNSALVLNKTIAISGRSLTVTLHPTKGTHAIINAIEVFEVVMAESKTLVEEVRAMQKLKSALGLPLRFGWNGDPCVPQQHPWSGADCQLDRTTNKWVIDGLGLDNQGLRGSLPSDISGLHHLQSINLSGNSIHGAIPSSLGTITSLEVLDLSYNSFNGSIPESLGQLTALHILNLNGNSLRGKVPAALGGRLLHRASFNFTDNAGLCGIPGLRTCGPHLSIGAKIGIGIAACIMLLLIVTLLTCWWKRRKNILRAQKIAARNAPYAKARTHFSRDVQLTRHNNSHENTRTAAENGPILLS